MAAPAKYPTPHAQLLRLATNARAEGVPFEEFWEQAVRPGRARVMVRTPPEKRPAAPCVIWPNDSFDRENGIAATIEAKEGWRRAYEGMPPSSPERALAMLGPDLRVDPAQVQEAVIEAIAIGGLPDAAPVASAA